MLAYVFWHNAAPGVSSELYEESLITFHRILAAHAPEGFLGSASFAFSDAPWFPAPSGYLDWYNVADFASLGALNDAAVSGARKEPHDQVARIAGAGFGGLFRLRSGASNLPRTRTGVWLRKPDSMQYEAFLDGASRLVDPATMGLWQRQMSLGPGPEFCLLSPQRIEAPQPFAPVTIDLRPIWSQLP